ncbi:MULTISPECIES: LysR family transcriptional regulator [Bacillus]|uniref:LysR family transcriptional regulator n=1 Tax=Bacillus arachidis TaxID=2819290 RepID=A0ABS3NWH6_9BACI|nr:MULTISPECIES: LysR family transcriptional regulator [Bacillus]MBO1625284.1 LysR family transcriptional regulator [Bacillus arachidis]WIY60630.1 LysR family transcriptional regulator [Bacillus arachidis]SDY58809.1 DNA-binding transcriptional regulator, LysR family [Bacillus sp. 166amftsu]
MDFEAVQSFIEVKHTRSLSKASKRLHISQPALSKQIQRLEADLEVKLLKRSTQGVELTDAGELFIKRIEPIIEQINEVKGELKEYQEKKKISIGVLPSLAAHYISKCKSILETYEVEWQIEHTKVLMELFRERKIDAMLIDSEVEGAKFVKEVKRESIVCVVSNEHAYKDEHTIQIKNLQHEKLIIYPEICDIRKMIMTTFKGMGVKPTIAVETSYAEPMLAMVRAGLGITLLPEIAVKQAMQAGIRVMHVEPTLTRVIYFISHREEMSLLKALQ